MNEPALPAVGTSRPVERMRRRGRVVGESVVPNDILRVRRGEAPPEGELESPALRPPWPAPEAEVPDAVESLRQDMLEEPPHELVRAERHRGEASGAGGLVAEGDVVVGYAQDVAVRDDAAVYVTGHVPEHGVGRARRAFSGGIMTRAACGRKRGPGPAGMK